MKSLINQNVGEYRVVEFLGAGGMGEVYRAIHNKIGRIAAVKVLMQSANDSGLLDRFFNEARIQAGLHHPNIATLYDFVELDGQPCIVMEYVDGQTLTDRVRPHGPLPLAETVYIFQAVVEAVAYLHNHGIVHRDIKSNNIKISSDGQVKLLDFGIAKAETSPGMTATGSVMGTLQYMSPQQLIGDVADARSDIWALGVLLYEMVTGRVPFDAATLSELCKKIERVDYAPPRVLNPNVPREVMAIISRCLRKNPMDRYRLAQDLLEDTKRLRGLVSTPGLSVVASRVPLPAWPFNLPQINLNWKLLSLVGGTLAFLLILVIGIYFIGNYAVAPAMEGMAQERNVEGRAVTSQEVGGDDQLRPITIDVFEGKAEVYLDGERVGETPYSLKARIGELVKLTLKRDGFEDKDESFQVTAQTKIKTFPMKRK